MTLSLYPLLPTSISWYPPLLGSALVSEHGVTPSFLVAGAGGGGVPPSKLTAGLGGGEGCPGTKEAEPLPKHLLSTCCIPSPAVSNTAPTLISCWDPDSEELHGVRGRSRKCGLELNEEEDLGEQETEAGEKEQGCGPLAVV